MQFLSFGFKVFHNEIGVSSLSAREGSLLYSDLGVMFIDCLAPQVLADGNTAQQGEYCHMVSIKASDGRNAYKVLIGKPFSGPTIGASVEHIMRLDSGTDGNHEATMRF
jgi:hypothetical protein